MGSMDTASRPVEPGQWIVDLNHDHVLRVIGPWPDAPDQWVVAPTVMRNPSEPGGQLDGSLITVRTGDHLRSGRVWECPAPDGCELCHRHDVIAPPLTFDDDTVSLFDGQPRTGEAVGRPKPDDEYGFIWVRIYEPIAEQLKTGWSPECRIRLAYIGSTHELVAMSLDDPLATDKRFNTKGL